MRSQVKKSLVIYDSEYMYAYNLMEILSRKRELAFQLYVCTSLERLIQFSEQNRIDILLIEETIDLDTRKMLAAEKVFVLTRGSASELSSSEHQIYKYQSAGGILSEILRVCLNDQEQGLYNPVSKKKLKILAVYSPIHRVGKTLFALEMGKSLARGKRTLYLNFERYSGDTCYFSPHDSAYSQGYNPRAREKTSVQPNTSKAGGMEQLLYYTKQEEVDLGVRLSTMVDQLEELDFVLPLPVSCDLKELTSEDWKSLFQQIEKKSVYEILILDLDETVNGLFDILEVCDVIYMPIRNDKISIAKVKQYERHVEILGYQKINECTKKLILPRDIPSFVSRLMRG